MEVEEAGSNPAKLAEAIHAQFDNGRRAVPVTDIAKALDILEIRAEPLSNFEGALITTAERGLGSILVNGESDRRRQAFTIAHELGHFLNGWHQPTEDGGGGFWCSREDVRTGKWTLKRGLSRHEFQEREANRFAIELLAPRKLLKTDLCRAPDLAHVVSIARDFDISREAAARRYVDLHPEAVAIAFSHAGKLRYWAGSLGNRRGAIASGDRVPQLPAPRNGERLSGVEEADPSDWLGEPDPGSACRQPPESSG